MWDHHFLLAHCLTASWNWMLRTTEEAEEVTGNKQQGQPNQASLCLEIISGNWPFNILGSRRSTQACSLQPPDVRTRTNSSRCRPLMGTVCSLAKKLITQHYHMELWFLQEGLVSHSRVSTIECTHCVDTTQLLVVNLLLPLGKTRQC